MRTPKICSTLQAKQVPDRLRTVSLECHRHCSFGWILEPCAALAGELLASLRREGTNHGCTSRMLKSLLQTIVGDLFGVQLQTTSEAKHRTFLVESYVFFLRGEASAAYYLYWSCFPT